MRRPTVCAVTALCLGLAACSAAPADISAERASDGASRAPSPTLTVPTTSEGTPGTEREKSPGSPRTGPPRRTTVTIVGDIMLGRRVEQAALAQGDVNAPLRPLQARLARSDLTVGNLESTLSRDGAPTQGDDSFAARPAVLRGLARSGFDVLSLANNHTGDFGEAALLQTLRRVRTSPVAAVGAGADLASAWQPVVLRRNGVRFGFVAFNAIGETPRATSDTPGAASVRMQPRTGPLNRADLQRAVRTVRRLDRGRADVVIVLPHWGAQYTHTPVPAQRRVARALVNAGADLVVGGHPHWVQRVQRHRGVPILHSLGNFVFDMDFSQQTQEGVIADAVFVGDALRAVRFTPYVIGDDFAPRVVRGERAQEIRGPVGVPARLRVSR